ncbi:TraB/GumN family protein [Herbaspirillum rhizosphaerae]|uniref:TraB/GumN family protein n=1 Tax=Herbaspirillum rhizosphaerae TaxID=346179 RepID=UPI00067A8A07|nr:TraB/GumN family protein [Herbaspirillum rhizosphaerae]
MVRRLIIVTFAWLLCLYLPAAGAASSTQEAGGKGQHGALFKVQDAHHTLYLFGTIHVGADNFYPLAPRVMQALEQAPAIALEIDPQKIPAMQAAVLQYGFYPDGKSYRTELPPQLRQQLETALQKYHVAPDTVARFRPWMIASLLTVQEFDSKGYRSELAVDSYLADIVKKRNKPVIELEGAATQLALFGALSERQQNLLLEDTIKELNDPDSAAKVVELAECWRTGNLDGLQGLLDEMESDKSFVGRFTREVLLDQRNPSLTDRIAALLGQQDGVFAAIGILHLVGPTSVPALLKQRGYTIERLY